METKVGSWCSETMAKMTRLEEENEVLKKAIIVEELKITEDGTDRLFVITTPFAKWEQGNDAQDIQEHSRNKIFQCRRNVGSFELQDIMTKYNEVNCVDKLTWCETLILSRRWGS